MAPRAPIPHLNHPHLVHRRRPRRLGRALERLAAPFVLPVLAIATMAAWLASRSYATVGVVTEQLTRPNPVGIVDVDTATFFVVGITERGDTTGVTVLTGMGDYLRLLGDRVTYGALYDNLDSFFAEGGSRAIVARVVGASATVGTLTLVDRAGSPLNTLRIDALNAGAWSARIKIAVANGAISNRFNITVLLDDVAVESFTEIATPAEAETRLQQSAYVRATNLASATAAPNNNPAVLAATVLSTGADDRGSLASSDYTAALTRFAKELGPGAVAIPGQDNSAVGAGLVAHAKANDRIALIATAVAQTPTQAITAAVVFRTTSGSEGAGLFYPWVKVSDGAGGTRTISPEGYVAAARARAHQTAGPWQAAAGARSTARGRVVGVERILTHAEIDSCVVGHVNPIRGDRGVQLYGWRSLSLDESNYRQLTGRDTLNAIAGLGAVALEPFVFGTIDQRGHYLLQLATAIRGIVEPMANAGGLHPSFDPITGDPIDPGYIIDTGPGVNTPDVLAADHAIVDVAVRVEPTAELIRVRITKVSFTSSLT